MKTYLVTGAAGFIGSQTARLLLERGDAVVGIDNLNDYYDVRIKEHRLAELRRYSNFSFQFVDVEDSRALESVFEGAPGFKAVFHLAARAGVRFSLKRPDLYAATNVNGAIHLLECCRRYGPQKIILASTSSLYANESMPFSEAAATNRPRSPYAATKKAAEVMAYTYHHLYGLDVSILRYFTVYGPAGRPDMAPLRFIRWIDEDTPITLYGDGSQGRDFTYVEDIARGTVAAEKNLGYAIINLGCGQQPVILREFIRRIETLLGKKACINSESFISADMKQTRADITQARELLNWEPSTDLQTGLEQTIAWYRTHRSWLCTLPF